MSANDDDFCGGIRGTVADAVDFARDIAAEHGHRVTLRVDQRRDELPAIRPGRETHDGPTWEVTAS